MIDFLIQKYVIPITESSNSSAPLMTPKQVSLIFSNITSILNINQILLKQLSARISNWSDSSCIGDIFCELAPFLKIYTLYCGNYTKASTILSVLSTKSDPLDTFLKTAASYSDELDKSLPSLLVAPIQRLPRYQLMLREVLKFTEESHVDYKNISEALEKIADINSLVNESIRDMEEFEKILALQKQFIGYCPPLVAPHRKLLKTGVLLKVCRKRDKPRVFFLFSDCLIYAVKVEAVNGYRHHFLLNLHNAQLKSLPDTSKTRYSFQILSKQKSFTVCAKDEEEKEQWTSEIQATIANLKSVHASRQHAQEVSGNSQAPVWIPDSEAETCMQCGSKFTLLFRRHHCRQCGQIVCSDCTQNRFFFESLHEYARVCAACYKTLTRNSDDATNLKSSAPLTAGTGWQSSKREFTAKTDSFIGARFSPQHAENATTTDNPSLNPRQSRVTLEQMRDYLMLQTDLQLLQQNLTESDMREIQAELHTNQTSTSASEQASFVPAKVSAATTNNRGRTELALRGASSPHPASEDTPTTPTTLESSS
ncbi:FYVE, RhoGEF and PH domain containing protein [Pelomyxa schiedti]|nr:FYVE, RhoGEF and PH domain containing protein [Pelomyxa schiedti]